MMKTRTLLLFAALALCVSMRAQTFTLGADISWETEMLAKGYTFANAKGESRECAALMRELGLNAIRLRVWVNPPTAIATRTTSSPRLPRLRLRAWT